MSESEKKKSGIVVETNAEYHGYREAISKSRLANMAVCPQYFKWCEDNPQEPTDDLILGSAFHKIVLETDTFDKEFVILPEINRRTKEGKDLYETFLKENEGKTLLTVEQMQTITAMRDSVMSNKYSARLLNGQREQSMYFYDDLTKEYCKVRPDCYRFITGANGEKRVIIPDLKSCRSARTDDFMRDVVRYSYDLQAYMYSYGVSKTLNIPMANIDFIFIAVEKKAPHLTNILQADSYILERGEALFRKYIGEYHECKKTGEWYGLNGAYGYFNNLSLPSYLLKEVMQGE